jgi:hypothetical protein
VVEDEPTGPLRGHYLLFTEAVVPEAAECAETATTCAKGHGRFWMCAPEAQCRAQRLPRLAGGGINPVRHLPTLKPCHRRNQRRNDHGVTSLPPQAASAAAIEALWRGLWAIDIQVHDVRDRTLREVAGQVRSEPAPQALAALRHGLLSFCTCSGVRTSPVPTGTVARVLPARFSRPLRLCLDFDAALARL